jgi:hypothetical protein
MQEDAEIKYCKAVLFLRVVYGYNVRLSVHMFRLRKIPN